MDIVKSDFRFNYETGKWDYLIKNFCGVLGCTLVIKHGEMMHPLTGKEDKPKAEDYGKALIGDMGNSTLFVIGENTIEVDMPKAADGSFPFERVNKDT